MGRELVRSLELVSLFCLFWRLVLPFPLPPPPHPFPIPCPRETPDTACRELQVKVLVSPAINVGILSANLG